MSAHKQVLGHQFSEVVCIVVFRLNISHDDVTLHNVVVDEVIFCVNMLES